MKRAKATLFSCTSRCTGGLCYATGIPQEGICPHATCIPHDGTIPRALSLHSTTHRSIRTTGRLLCRTSLFFFDKPLCHAGILVVSRHLPPQSTTMPAFLFLPPLPPPSFPIALLFSSSDLELWRFRHLVLFSMRPQNRRKSALPEIAHTAADVRLFSRSSTLYDSHWFSACFVPRLFFISDPSVSTASFLSHRSTLLDAAIRLPPAPRSSSPRRLFLAPTSRSGAAFHSDAGSIGAGKEHTHVPPRCSGVFFSFLLYVFPFRPLASVQPFPCLSARSRFLPLRGLLSFHPASAPLCAHRRALFPSWLWR